ncbi:MAG: transposase, partial [Nitrospirae bacterium]|nr:transposase [Nitrospirota bacterium]
EGLIEGEIKGKAEGLLEGIEAILEIKYGSNGLELMDMIRNIGTLEKLSQLKVIIKKSDTVDEVRASLIAMLK